MVLRAISLVIAAYMLRRGYDRLGLKLLHYGLEKEKIMVHRIIVTGMPKQTMMQVVFEDKELVQELGDRRQNDVAIAKTTWDVN